MQLIEQNKKLLYERGGEYIVSIGNLMNMCRELGKEDELLALFNKATRFMDELPANYHDQYLDERFCNLLNSRITFLYTKKKYTDAITLGEDLFKKLNKHTSAFQNSIYNVLCQNMIFSGFYSNDFKTANKFYNMWLKEKAVDDIQKKLFGIVLYYEQGDTDLCFYRCKSLRYALRTKKQKDSFAAVFEKYFTTVLLDITDKKETKKAFETLYRLVLKDKNLYQSMTNTNEFNYEHWIKTKINV